MATFTENGLLGRAIAENGKDRHKVEWKPVQTISDCWHFYSSGKAVDAMFLDDRDFIEGMNRIYVIARKYNIDILAFSLMHTHFHFILHGPYDLCLKFIREFIRLTSMQIAYRRKEHKKLKGLPVGCQKIEELRHIRTSICYVLRNGMAAGLPYSAYNYPWSSASLMFVSQNSWASSNPADAFSSTSGNKTVRGLKKTMKTHYKFPKDLKMNSELIYPGEYVNVIAAEKLFGNQRVFNAVMASCREQVIDDQLDLSRPELSYQELRDHRDEFIMAKYGNEVNYKSLSIDQRIRIASMLRRKYGCTKRQADRELGLASAGGKEPDKKEPADRSKHIPEKKNETIP